MVGKLTGKLSRYMQFIPANSRRSQSKKHLLLPSLFNIHNQLVTDVSVPTSILRNSETSRRILLFQGWLPKSRFSPLPARCEYLSKSIESSTFDLLL